MPRGRKKKFKLDRVVKPDVAKSFLAVFLILFGGLSLLSFFASGYAVNAQIQEVLMGSFGFASFLVPFISALFGLLLIDSIKFSFKTPRILIGLLIMLFVLSGVSRGGDFGKNLWEFLASAVSKYGAFLILSAGLVVAIIMISNASLDQMFSFLGSKTSFLKKLKKGDTAEAKEMKEHIVVNQGIPADSGDTNFSSSDVPEVPETKIEIIPTMSEPQQPDLVQLSQRMGDPNQLTSLVPSLPYSDRVWENPPLDLLTDAPEAPVDRGNVNERKEIIISTLKSFGIEVTVKDIKYGPSVTQYALEAATGTKISKIAALQYDLALALASPTGSVRIEAPIPGKALIGIEVPNNTRVPVHFKQLLTSDPMKAMKSKLAVVMGKDVGGQTVVYDIAKMPHLLVAGATGSGKSVFLHSVIFSMLFRASPQEINFILIDPKRTELIHYNDIPHLITPVITDVSQAPSAFKWAVNEMERRYKLLEGAKVRNIEAYNEKSGFQALPYTIIIVDELAEIMLVDPASVEKNIIRIAQLARAVGIHLILAVQRPSTNIITGLIKANIPSRVAFNVASQVDSRVIIDQPGAEKLLGKGDMLFIPPDAPKPTRLQGAFVTDKEISTLVGWLKTQGIPPEYKPEIYQMADKMEKSEKSIAAGGDHVDDLFEEAIEIVTSTGKASASLLQRRLSVGYARAARILDELEEKGIIGPAQGQKPREVYGHKSDSLSDPDESSFPQY